jgi:hypothetical protein
VALVAARRHHENPVVTDIGYNDWIYRIELSHAADYSVPVPDVPGLVVCRWCHLLGPDSPDGLIRLPSELEAMARRDGWRFEVEVSDWICPECIVRRDRAGEN